MECIVFDMDQTLVNSDTLHMKAFEDILDKRGYDFSKTEFVYGWTNEEFLIKNFPDMKKWERMKLIREKQKIFIKKYVKKAKPLPHAKEVLKQLKKDGKKVCILTQESPRESKALIKVLGFNKFNVVIDSNNVKKYKPNPEGLRKIRKKVKVKKKEMIFVGDSIHDFNAARRYGIKFILMTKIHRIDEWKKADYVITDLRKVLKIV